MIATENEQLRRCFGQTGRYSRAAAALQALLRPLPDEALEMYLVNPKIVNGGRIDCPECVLPWVG